MQAKLPNYLMSLKCKIPFQIRQFLRLQAATLSPSSFLLYPLYFTLSLSSNHLPHQGLQPNQAIYPTRGRILQFLLLLVLLWLSRTSILSIKLMIYDVYMNSYD